MNIRNKNCVASLEKMIHHNTTINSSKISSFVQKGEKIPVVFIHGFCEDSKVWIDFLVDFPDNYIICIDLPGFGKSDVIKNCSIRDMALILYSVLKEHGISRCLLVGHSMGGYVALEFAKQFPKKISGLVLFHSQCYADSMSKIESRKRNIDFIRKNGAIHFVKQLIPNLFASRFGSKSSLTISKLILWASYYHEDGIINALEAMIHRGENQALLKNADYPVLFIVGEEDIAIPKENSINQLVLPNISIIHILLGVGHMGMFEAKKECVSIIKNFIAFIEQ